VRSALIGHGALKHNKSAIMHTTVIKSTCGADALMDIDPEGFPARFNRELFGFRHRLHELPIFAPEAMQRLAERYAPHPREFFVSAGAPRAGSRFTSVRNGQLGVVEAMQRLDSEPTRVLLKRPENHDPVFWEVLDQLFSEVLRLRGGLRGERLMRLESAIFITSARSITPFHFDPEIAFFMQVEGRKTYHVYSPASVSEVELENFYRQGVVSIAEVDLASRDSRLERVYNLDAGDGHHQPHDSPHWVETGAERSVSYSFVFETDATRARSRARAFNYYVRRAGMTPRNVGSNRVRDAAKAATMRVAFPVRRRLLRLMPDARGA
jgi:hypothetical protein